MQLIAAPRHFDTILTENMFGDVLSDRPHGIRLASSVRPRIIRSADGAT
jgi:isocitrate/isopropylmalate dehydrogenase